MKFITVPKESVLSELADGHKVLLIDRYAECIDNVEDMEVVELARIIEGDTEETQYEFYKEVITE